jgi:hypothetical protein
MDFQNEATAMRAMLAANAVFACAAAAVLCAGSLVRAQQFSADLVVSNAAGGIIGSPGKIFVADRKVRIETAEFPNSYLLVDGTVPAAYLVRQRLRVFMDAKQSSRLTRLFVSSGGTDPCPQWRSMGEVAGIEGDSSRWHCEVEEPETVGGRATTKFETTSTLRSIFPLSFSSTMAPFWRCAVFRKARSRRRYLKFRRPSRNSINRCS